MRRVHPFLSPIGIGITLLVFLGLGFSLWVNGGEMFSPGDLTSQSSTGVILGGYTSHADFEAACENCHAPLVTSQADLCLRCHTAVGTQILSRVATHAGIEGINRCQSCHPDHQGRDFDPTQAAFARFDHSLTRFSLHWHQLDYDLTPMDCYTCHDRQQGFALDLPSCQDCHAGEDPGFLTSHVLDFGDDCLACHDGLDRMVDFDHAATNYPLEGRHAAASCAGCHLQGQFAGTPARCESCHLEPASHAGLFSTDCAACHNPQGWAFLVGSVAQPFDHFLQAGFSLDRHQVDYRGDPLQCAACHTSGDGFEIGFKQDFCTDCHTNNDSGFMAEHLAQFGSGCLSCHDGVDRMADFDHNQSFPLEGAHAGISCESCHLAGVFAGTPAACVDCHAEPEIHAGYFGLQCQNCHTAAAWTPAKMQSHTFPLDHGEQGLVPCEVCHVTRYTEYTCYGCHEHQSAEVAEEHRQEGISAARLEDCMACHPDGLEHEDD